MQRRSTVRLIALLTLFLTVAFAAGAQSTPISSFQAIHQLTNTQAADHLPVDFIATITYYRPYEHTMFVQDGNTAIYVQPTSVYPFTVGDRVEIRGTTKESFRPFVMADSVRLIAHGASIKPVTATYDDLIQVRDDCRLVTLRGRVLSADITISSDRRSTIMQLQMDGGKIRVEVDSDDAAALAGLLDTQVEATGAVSGRFDGKMQMTGIVLHVQDLKDIKIIRSAEQNAWTLPVTSMDEILSAYRENSQSRRVRVQGTITYYMPGSAVVLQNGARSVWIATQTLSDLRIGDQADATGFPDAHDGFLNLRDGEIQDSHVAAPVRPVEASWRELSDSHHVFDLVSTEGVVVAEVQEAAQDEYVVDSDGHLFSAIYRHPQGSNANAAMRHIAIGSRIRVQGICILENSNPFNAQVPFDLLLRNFDDVAVIARPSWLSVANLMRLVMVLLLIVLMVSAWGWVMSRKAQRQTTALARRIESEAALERLNAQIEQRRSRILEDINGSRPLAEILEEITDLVSFQLGGAPCWCEITDGARLGNWQSNTKGRRIVRDEIHGRTAAPLGALFVSLVPEKSSAAESEALILGTRLATLAIETRRMYSDLVHRSEFDLLTDIHNRFSLDKQMELLIGNAREHATIFGLIYVDLDEFKLVNDVYGHRVGDLYLQEVTTRMKRQLRGSDLLARLGGDEFAVLVPTARNRSDVEEIAFRLERCFADPFVLESYSINGTASIGIALYPEDGTTKDSLLSTADAAMYVTKYTKRERGVSSEDEQDSTYGKRGRS